MRAPALMLLLLPWICACQPAAAPSGPPQDSAAASAPALPPAPPPETRESAEYRLSISRVAIDPAARPLIRAVEAQLAQLRDEFIGQALAAQAEGMEFPQPWSLQVEMQALHRSDTLVVLGLAGHQYSGGAHGLPLQGSFVYLPGQQRLMSVQDWFVDAAAFEAISGAAVEALQQQLGAELGSALEEGALEWIRTGAAPDPANFELYRPLLDDAGLIRAFEFSFQPYQVGPYAIGTPSVAVAADRLTPFLHPDLRAHFIH